MKHIVPYRWSSTRRKSGFTLVEMLVAVALVVLMMTLFAQIFQFSTQTMSVQKGTAENDQHVRLVMTMLRNDLKNRSFLDITPFLNAPGDARNTEDIDNRKGYFYIGENDPDDDTDDILQFTTLNVPAINGDQPWYGKATPIQGTFYTDPNQPEFDDGIVAANNSSESHAAEVCYFLRAGTLYRRVLLIREPNIPANSTDGTPQNGPAGTGGGMSTTAYENGGTRNFYTDQDFSAHYDTTVVPNGIKFHGLNELGNTQGGQFPLGKPFNRFGFDYSTGLPRAFTTHSASGASTTPTPRFFGRFTHEETSFIGTGNPLPSFGYPGRVTAASPDPYLTGANPTLLTYDTDTNKIREYQGGTRIGEDILMTNVLRFDIKVFDDAASLGADGKPGIGFLPGPDGIMYTTDDLPFDDDGINGPNDPGEIAWPGSDDGDFRDVGHSGFILGGNDVSFYSARNMAVSQRGSYAQQNPLKPTGAQPWQNLLYHFDTWNQDLTGEPPFRAPEASVTTPWGNLNRRVLRAIQIRITFLDPASQQTRDVTHVFSLTNF